MKTLRIKLVILVTLCVVVVYIINYTFYLDGPSTTISSSHKIQSAAQHLPYVGMKNDNYQATKPTSHVTEEHSKTSEEKFAAANLRAEGLLYEWEAQNTKILSYLNSSANDDGKTGNFLLPKLEASKLEEIAKQESSGNIGVQEEILEHLQQAVRRPLDKFMYINVRLGDSSSEDRVIYLELENENSFHVDPVSGKSHVSGTSARESTLGEKEKIRYQRIFQLR